MNKVYTLETDPFYLEIPNFYTADECDMLHYSFMHLHPQMIDTDTRKCIRREKLDWKLSDLVYKEIEHHLPVLIANGTGYQYRTRMNGIFVHVIYSTGEQFKPHMDGSYTTPNGAMETRMTWLLYLSTPKKGATLFHDKYGKVVHRCEAEKGKVVLFSHKMQHSGELVDGCKATLRNDIFYS
jgi:predicted 2-oxoglutarate/Fe(II)-dependent dioxygenase YbiX